jgi:hypothetical protein
VRLEKGFCVGEEVIWLRVKAGHAWEGWVRGRFGSRLDVYNCKEPVSEFLLKCKQFQSNLFLCFLL